MPNTVLLVRVGRLTKEHGDHNKRIYGGASSKRTQYLKTCTAPPIGVIKLNVDASLEIEGWIEIWYSSTQS